MIKLSLLKHRTQEGLYRTILRSRLNDFLRDNPEWELIKK